MTTRGPRVTLIRRDTVVSVDMLSRAAGLHPVDVFRTSRG